MQEEQPTKYQEGEESQQKEEDIQNWVKANQPDTSEAEYVRLKYYKIEGLISPNLQKQESIEQGQTTMHIYAPKNVDPYRMRYYKKLMDMNILREGPNKKYQHLLIFDWDDTLLCTSHLNSLHFVNIPEQTKEVLKRLDEVVVNTLNLGFESGQVSVFIITNGVEGWVQYSCRLYLPNSYEIVEQKMKKKKIVIISARSQFEKKYPGDCGKWKMQAFKGLLHTYINPELLTNMICIGDSNLQIEAATALGKMFDEAVVKTIKLKRNPKPQQMIKQLVLIGHKFIGIFNSTKNLTVRLQRKKTEKKVETVEQQSKSEQKKEEQREQSKPEGQNSEKQRNSEKLESSQKSEISEKS